MSTASYQYNTLAGFNSVIIIETLSDSEAKNGHVLSDNLKQYCIDNNLLLNIFFFSVRNKTEFQDLMRGISDAIYTSSYQFKPIIHFEIHGYEDLSGLALTDHALGSQGSVSWNEFCGMTRPINYLLKNNLFLSMSVCFGFFMQLPIYTWLKLPHFGAF